MGRDKRPGKVEAHIRITLHLLDSPAFLALDWTARALFLDLRARMRSTNNGDINAAFSELQHRGWSSPTTLAKALPQLEAVGLLRRPVSREELDHITGCSNGPELVADLRRRGLGHEHLPCERIRFIDRDGFTCRPGVYSLTEQGRRMVYAWLAKRKQGGAI